MLGLNCRRLWMSHDLRTQRSDEFTPVERLVFSESSPAVRVQLISWSGRAAQGTSALNECADLLHSQILYICILTSTYREENWKALSFKSRRMRITVQWSKNLQKSAQGTGPATGSGRAVPGSSGPKSSSKLLLATSSPVTSVLRAVHETTRCSGD